MAKKVDLIESDVEDVDLTSEERDALEALSELEGAADARWQIHRLKVFGDDKAPGYLGEMTSAELRLSEIQRRWGKGKYRLKGLRSNGTYIKSTTVEVADDLPQKSVPAMTPAADSVKDFMAMVQEREERRAERNRELMLAVVPGAIAGLTGIVTAMMNRPQAQNNVLQDLATLKAVIGPQPERDSPTELMVKMLELGRKYGEKGGGGDSWIDVVKEAVQAAGPLLVEKLGHSPAPTPQHTPAQLSAPQPQPQPQPAPQGEPVKNPLTLLNWAREKLAYLTQKASKNLDASLYADWLVNEVPDGVDILEFAKYLAHPDWWTYLQQFSPGVAPYQGWFAEFRDVLIDVLEEKFAVELIQRDESELASDNEAGEGGVHEA